MARAYRRREDPAVSAVELAQHEDFSQVLYIMMQQAAGIRGALRRATGRSSRPSQAVVALVEAVGHLAEVLLDAHDATFGPKSNPMVRTRYVAGA
jgi:hypothetical protein